MLPVSAPQSRSRPTTNRSWGKLQKSAASSLAVASTALVRDGKKYLLVHPSVGHLASWPHLGPCLSRRDDAGRRLREGAGSLDRPRAAGEGHVRLRHQARLLWHPSPLGGPGDGFRAPHGCWHQDLVAGGVRATVPVPPRSQNQFHPMALMNLHLGLISFASFRFYANSFQQTRGDCSDEKGQGNCVWVVLLFN